MSSFWTPCASVVAVGVGWTLLPVHPCRVVEEVLRVREAGTAEELDEVGVAVGEACVPRADGDATATGSGGAAHDDGRGGGVPDVGAVVVGVMGGASGVG